MKTRWVLAAGVLFLFSLLNFEWMNEVVGVPLVAVGSLLAAMSPEAFCVGLAASQNVADPVGSPLTVAQALFAGWAVTLPWNGWLPLRRAALRFGLWWLPLSAWVCAVGLVNGTFDLLGNTLVLGLAFGVVTSGYVARRPGGERGLMLALLLGALLSALGYWGKRADLPVIAGIYEADQSRQVDRVGSGRGDANTVGATLPLAFAGLGLLALEHGMRARDGRVATGALAVVIAVALLTVPPTLATASRTGLYALAAGFGSWAVVSSLPQGLRLRPPETSRGWYVAGLLALAGGLTVAVLLIPELPDYVEGALRQNAFQSQQTGSPAVIAGRSDAWLTHLRLIARHPIAGIGRGETWDFGEYGVTTVGESGIYGAAHNTILEFGSLAGVPGVLLFIATLAALSHRCWVRRPDLRSALLVTGVITLAAMSGLSIPGWKVFWGFAALFLTASSEAQAPTHVRLRRTR